MKFTKIVTLFAFLAGSEAKFSCYVDVQGQAKCGKMTLIDTLKSEMAVLEEGDDNSWEAN